MMIVQMITGHPPFHELNVMQAMMKIAQGHRPSRPSDSGILSQAMSDDLWTLMDACWMMNPELRPTMSNILISLGAMTRQAVHQHQLAVSLSPPHPSFSPFASSERSSELSNLVYHSSTPFVSGTVAGSLHAPGTTSALDPDLSIIGLHAQAETLVARTNDAMSHPQTKVLPAGVKPAPSHLDLVCLPSLNAAEMRMSPTALSPSPTMSEQSIDYWGTPVSPRAISAQVQPSWGQRAGSPTDSELSVGPSDSRMSSPGILSDGSGYSAGSGSSRRSSRRRTLPRSPYFRQPSRLRKADNLSPSNLDTVDGLFLDFLARLCSNREHGQYWLWKTDR
jgi:hypothetical protein